MAETNEPNPEKRPQPNPDAQRPAQSGAPRPGQPTGPRPGQPGAAKPGQPAQPGAAKPGQPVQPGARPAQPGQPGAAKPGQPAQPGARPAQPGQPGARPPAPGSRPAQPGAAAGRPATPGQPGAARPGAPARPGTAPAAGKPAGAAQTGKPAAGDGARKPAAPGEGAKRPAPTGDGAGKPPAAKGAPGKSARDKLAAPKRVIKGAADLASGSRRLGQVLVDLGYLDEEQLWELLDEAKTTGNQIGQVAVSRGLVNDEQLFQAIAEQAGLRVVNLEEVKPTPEAVAAVPETMATIYKVLPLTYKDNALTVAISDPANLSGLDDLRNFLNITDVQAVLAPQHLLTEAMTKAYAGKEETLVDVISALESDGELGGASSRRPETSIDLDSLEEIAQAAPVRKLLNMVMLMAIKDHASDIHFEPFEDEYKMRYRCDGVLYEMVPPPRHLANAISTRIKVMANLDIAERRLPQDGRIELNVGGNPVDMRVSVLPTMFGESVVIRVLDRTVVNLDLGKIGMEQHLIDQWREMIHRPNGIILVTGPTGSGKTTTLYSSLNELNEITDKIITCEDPIEYDIDGIIQVPINSDIGVTFASCLRSILRQDPDIILVGEIRDLETAQIAVQAALTGHTVFSTLHTNDAPSTITRLRDMGVESFLITATVQGILAQRLVRRICDDCRTEYEPSDEILLELNLTREQVKGKKFYYGKGCDRCNNTGHRRRSGLFELVMMTDELRDMISAGLSTDQLAEACRKQGMVTLREAGLRAIFSGVTTIEEVVHETVFEEDL